MSESTDKPAERESVPVATAPHEAGSAGVERYTALAETLPADQWPGAAASQGSGVDPGLTRQNDSARDGGTAADSVRSTAVPRPVMTGAPVLLAQAVVPGLGYALLRRPQRAVLTAAMFALLTLVAYWQFPKDSHRPFNAWLAFGVIMGAVWLNLLYRTANDLRVAAILANGHDLDAVAVHRLVQAQQRGPLRWLFSLNLLVVALVVFGINRLAVDAEVDILLFTKSSNLHAAKNLASGLFHPKWSIWRETVQRYAWVSLEMAALGTVGGALLAAPFSFLAARNLMGRHPVTLPVYYAMRFLFSCVRAIPTLIWGLIAISFTLGHFPGVIALSIFSFGLLSKLYSEAIEAIDWGQIEAVTAAGANPLQVILFAVVPQVVPYFISSTLYSLEVNVHSAVVLGLIGAGGLGLVINEYIGTFHWSEASMVLIITIVMTLAIDYGSAYIRSKVV
jgi:phosphonate transport system permease protein